MGLHHAKYLSLVMVPTRGVGLSSMWAYMVMLVYHTWHWIIRHVIKQSACMEHGLVGPHVALDFSTCVLIGTLVTLPQVVLDFPACGKGSLHLG